MEGDQVNSIRLLSFEFSPHCDLHSWENLPLGGGFLGTLRLATPNHATAMDIPDVQFTPFMSLTHTVEL